MKIGQILISTLLFFILNSYAKEFSVKIHIENCTSKVAYLSSVSCIKNIIIDSSQIHNGLLNFSLNSEKHKRGYYQITYGKKNGAEFIFNFEDIEFIVDAKKKESIYFLASEENKTYNRFYSNYVPIKNNLTILISAILLYPKDDDFYLTIKNEYDSLLNSYNQFITKFVNENKNTFAVQIIKSELNSPTNINISFEEQKQYTLNHFFDRYDFSNLDLLNSSILSRKIIEYLQFSNILRSPKKEQEIFIKSFIKELLGKAKEYKKVENSIINIFSQLFKGYQPSIYNYLRTLTENRKADK